MPESVKFRGLDGVERDAHHLAEGLNCLFIAAYDMVGVFSTCMVVLVNRHMTAFRPGDGVRDLREAEKAAIQPFP